jgi:hypothetical protein
MRKLVIGAGLTAAMMFAGANAFAQGATATYGMAGCGLGSLAFGKDNSKGMQILAATTNNIIVPQTFAITSGTSNCVAGGVVTAQREQTAFAEVNFQDLKRNMAMGGGEYLTSFSTLLGCEESAKPAFFKMSQNKYASLVPTAETTPVAMLSSVKQQIQADPALAAQCSDERAIARSEGRSAKPVNVALATPATKTATK